jgi:hypothetical protein
MILRTPSHGVLRAWGLVLAVISVVAPALPLGPLFAQPPVPLAVLWAAYGWAAEDNSGWRAPIGLALLGLLHDQLAGEAYGVFVAIYLSAYLIGRVAAATMSAPNLVSLWGGFIFTAAMTVGVAAIVAPIAHGGAATIIPYAEAAAISALLFPLVRPLYMTATGTPRVQTGGRR